MFKKRSLLLILDQFCRLIETRGQLFEKGYAVPYPFNYADKRFLFEITHFDDRNMGDIFDDSKMGQGS